MKQKLPTQKNTYKRRASLLAGGKLTLLLFISVVLLSAQTRAGTWTVLTNLAPHANGGGMLLLTDGTVIAKSTFGGASVGNTYDRLKPSITGSYVNGTWSSIAPMHDTRLYYSSQVLKDGRVYVAGGEYGTGKAKAEVYNPLTNVWTSTPAPLSDISDANSELLDNGNVLQALVAGGLTGTKIYNPATNTFAAGPTALGIHNESAWVKLPDNSILYVNRLSTSSERYIPATNTWINDGIVPVSLYDPFGLETGAAFLLPNGRAFFIGSSGHTAYYTPSGGIAPGVWAAGPDIPGGKGTPDAAAAMLVTGKILMAVSPIPTAANHFPTPTTFYEFDYLTNTYTALTAPNGAASINEACYLTNMLDLPNGQVLYADQGSQKYYVYTPTGAALAAGKPTISSITQTNCSLYSINGTRFNGISQGANYGDDWQMSTNYPIIRLESGANVYYARTENWNSTGVQRGAAADNCQFTLPAGLPAGTYSLYVIANGISSNAFTFNKLATPGVIKVNIAGKVCPGDLRTYSIPAVQFPGTYHWTVPVGATIASGQGTTAIRVSYGAAFVASGTVSVTHTNACGVSAASALLITKNILCFIITPFNGTEFSSVEGEASKVYPNPSNGLFTLLLYPSRDTRYDLSVHDLLGKEVLKESLDAEAGTIEHPIDLQHLQRGMYILSIHSPEGDQVIKIGKE